MVLLELWTTAGRALSATWTAPPPMIAPPQVQAHNLANAIRTDIGSTLLLCYLAARYRQIRKTGWRVFPIRINAK
ncbi:hypothetical protein J2W40_001699 [Sphingobium xenophagum]|uniref:Secreted protein n=2 Tax=Sphingobium xenophagum TaxID=121428 RepID=A0ABU1WZZ2_SPHXE|nr:hypothetical protein [Sphingobium xenophagum]